ncbi:hypothetical protein ONS95_008141 [Cadophora gregata]|uniref:uncharacterized protein n=1 Tax=Cadophora gregata TaxID=51156 RepID=UPI0026DB32C2|nr:uncharacterized protein ONS95_008141 [Cadophora gregata]KAK0119294.1 hypothetical protein ONS96_012352 [Cadophora gregata f. sp. sojae]KAK0126549.1 hypothetical protein ONS95_008141 [Cadophora gregata]
MRTLTLFAALQICASAVAQQSTPLGEYLATYPDCAAQCSVPVVDSLGNSNSSLVEVSAALCPDIPSMQTISACIQTTCSVADVKTAWPVQRNLCKDFQTPSKSAYIRNLTIIMALLAAVFVLLRCYSRTMIVKRFWWDDWNTAVAALFMVMIAVVMIWDSTIGLGLHAWDVDGPANLVQIAKVFYVMKLFYIIVQVLLKVSILLFYLRVFPVQWMQVVTWFLIVFTLLHGVGFFFPILFQCKPVAMLWNPLLQGHCINLETIIFPGAIFSIVEDLAILLLPIPCLSKLNVGKGKKISLIFMFSVGIIACVISIIRVKPVIYYRDTLDHSWDTIHLLAWSEAELTVATICVCLPSIKPILNHHVPRYFGSNSGVGFVVGNISPEPPSVDRDLIDSVQSENQRTWLGSRLTFKTFGTFGKSSKQLSEGSDFVSGNAAREEAVLDENERKGWRETNNEPEERLDLPTRESQMPRTPRRALVTLADDETRTSIDHDRDPWMEKVKRIRHLSEVTYDSSNPRSATGSRAEDRVMSMGTVPDQADRGRPTEPRERVQSMTEVREVPIFLENSSQVGQAGSYEEGSDADAASNETGSAARSWRSWSWHGGTQRDWRISSVRISRFRISAFGPRSDGSSMAESREEV